MCLLRGTDQSLYTASLTFSNSTFCPHSVFVWIWAIISLYSINWLVFMRRCVYCAVRTGSLYTASLTFSNSTFCPHSVFMCFVWIWEQTAIISLYSFNSLVFITETECVYCAVRTGSLYTTSLTFSNSTFCPHNLCVLCGTENKQRLFPYTTLTVWFLQPCRCLLRGTDFVNQAALPTHVEPPYHGKKKNPPEA